MFEIPAIPTFRGRKLELAAITAGPSEGIHVISFHGEAGIGKSRLLKEGALRLNTNPKALVLQVDLAALSPQREGRSLALLRILAGHSALLTTTADGPDAMAARIVDQMNLIAGERQITLLVDTTEAVQEDTSFWQWFEGTVLSPLVSEGNVLIVLAGRLPAPIRLVEVRRYLKVWPLAPLPMEDEARALVREVLAASQSRPALDDLANVALSFSHGHPLLSIEIARYLADPVNREPADSLRSRVAEEVVGRFIDEVFFRFGPGMSRWVPLMKWASVLDRFDATVLYRFDFAMSGCLQPEIEWQYDFVKAMAQLRAPYAVVKWEGAGYTLVGTVRSIVASYMQTARHAEYVQALSAAFKVFNAIAEDCFTDDPQAGEPYRRAAYSYQQRLRASRF